MFKGTGTALITPFNEKGVDYQSLELMIEDQIKGGIDALVICGTTGEPSTMTASERSQVIEFSIDRIAGRVPVIIGTGTNCTATSIENSVAAEKAGADGLLVVTPYYNKCTQQGLVLHYEAICKNTSLPVFTYNVPGRTGVNILPETAARLAEIKTIVGIKEACGNMEQIAKTKSLIAGSQMELFSGDDGLALDMVKLGGKGVISVASNVIPGPMHNFMKMALEGDIAGAEEFNRKYANFFSALFYEVNPIPVKHACSLRGLCQDLLRLPLTPMSAAQAVRLEEEMRKVNII